MGKPHEQLEAWKLSMHLAKVVYALTTGFPDTSDKGAMATVSLP